MAEKRVAHLIANAHVDPVWQWEWEEGAGEALSTFRAACEFCDENDGFVFNHNEAILYEWIEEYAPALFKRIQKLVKAGKWHIMGGWYLQPDCNLPSGESFVRQVLAGRKYFAGKFGKRPTTAINFDPFGHTRGIVQVIAKSGYDSYIFCRPWTQFCELPAEQFVWVGYDGSEVMASRSGSENYGSRSGMAIKKIETCLEKYSDRQCDFVLWGVGNHGGGPTRKDLNEIHQLMAERDDVDIIHSTPEKYFGELKKQIGDLPRYRGDMNPWAAGCYTSQVRIKMRHRKLENELYAAEKMCVAASTQRLMRYPTEELADAQRDLLYAEFHDILPGTSTPPVEEWALQLMGRGIETLSRVKARAFFALCAGQPKAKPGAQPICVFNPHPYDITTVVQVEYPTPRFGPGNGIVGSAYALSTLTQNGKPIPCQDEHPHANIPSNVRKRLSFTATLKAGQMNRFEADAEIVKAKPPIKLKEKDGRIVFKGEDYQVVINTRTGLVDRYRVKGVDYVEKNAFMPIVIKDTANTWAQLARRFSKRAGRFTLMSQEAACAFSGLKEKIKSVRVIEDGPVRSIVEAVFSFGHSFLVQRYILPKVGAEIELETRVIWNEKDLMLKLHVPTTGDNDKFLGQVAYGVEDYDCVGEEKAMHKWVLAGDTKSDRALTCVNDGIHGVDCSKRGMNLTLLRSPAYVAIDWYCRKLVPQDRFSPRCDQGERLYRLWFNAGPVKERADKIDREALIRNEKPMAVAWCPDGSGEKPKALAKFSDKTVQITAIKQAENGKAVIVRLFEPTGRTRKTTLSLPFADMKIPVEIGAFEIKTLRVNASRRTWKETNLLEEPL